MFESSSGRQRVMLSIALCGSIATGAATAQEAARDTTAPIEFSGYYKNLLSHSATSFPTQQPYNLDLNRLRLELKGQVSPALALELQYDNEILLGNYLRTAQFMEQADVRPRQYWQLESNYTQSSDLYGRHRFYRAFATWSSGDTDTRVGRQRIAWGTGRFWSPLDLLNPISPVQLEREERPGVDAVLVEHKLGELSRISAVYAPQRLSTDSAALYWHGNSATVDFSMVAGKFAGDRVLGADIATQVGNAGVHGELSFTSPRNGNNYQRALIGADYAFANTLTVSAELYFNGAGTTDVRAYDFAGWMSGRIQNVGRRYFGLFVSYDITQLLKTTQYFVANLHDGSRYFSPGLTYSLRTNVDWTVGIQAFSGSAASEYGRFSNVYYTQLQWFF